MIINKKVTRVFSFENISEDEAVVLRTLLNLNEQEVRNELNNNKGYWDFNLTEETAVKIGYKLCKSIMLAIDEDK